MAIKTFTTGEGLTASDTNTYLNSGGLVYITQANFASSGVTVANCFSSVYDNYRLVIQNTTATTDTALNLGFNASTGATYYGFGSYQNYNSTTTTGIANAVATARAQIGIIGSVNCCAIIDVYSPFLSTYTQAASSGNTQSGSPQRNTFTILDYGGVSNTGFSINVTSPQTMGGGSVIVYGYRKA